VTTRDLFSGTARQIGDRLAAQARWTGDQCLWDVRVSDPHERSNRRSIVAASGGTIYQGTAGIALFLAELARVSGDARHADAAAGALRHALGTVDERSPANFGFHSGTVGIAYTAVRCARLLDTRDYLAAAERLLAPLAGKEGTDRSFDVIGGGAGAIPALLAMADHVDRDLAVGIATALGQNFVAKARRGPIGWSWRATSPAWVRDLTGLAHGNAGIGAALLELFVATGDDLFRYAAEQAFCYERQFYDPAVGNWADLRNMELFYSVGRGADDLRRRLRAGETPAPYHLTFGNAWCHGAPGIGLTRLRAHAVLGDEIYLREAQAAVRTTRQSLESGPEMNYSLCHGVAGNCETLLAAARAWDDRELHDFVVRRVALGIERFETAGRPWPCGVVGYGADPSLLLGEAGIGFFLLRLTDPFIPNVLFLAESAKSSVVAGRERSGVARSTFVEEYFGRTLRVFARLFPDRPDPRVLLGRPGGNDDIATVFDAILRAMDDEDRDAAAQLADAFAPERARYEACLAITDFTSEFIARVVRPGVDEAPWSSGTFGLAPDARIVVTRRDWDAWLATQEAGGDGAAFVVFRQDNTARLWKLSPFALFVLENLAEAATLDDVAERIRAEMGDGDVHVWRERVEQQLRLAYGAGVVTCVSFDAVSAGAGT
jgi:hypothetical protein